MKKVTLPENHLRSVSASVYSVEKLLTELSQALQPPSETVMFKTDNNLKTEQLETMKLAIEKTRAHIRFLAAKYQLQPVEVKLSQIVNARKSGMWEILCNTVSKRLGGYGKFPEELSAEFDNDIARLQKLIDAI